MNVGHSGPFSFALGLGVCVLAMYLLDRAREEKRTKETQREIKALIKAIEVKASQEAKKE